MINHGGHGGHGEQSVRAALLSYTKIKPRSAQGRFQSDPVARRVGRRWWLAEDGIDLRIKNGYRRSPRVPYPSRLQLELLHGQ